MHRPDQVCRVCGDRSIFFGDGKVLDLEIHYSKCARCMYVQTENPYWLERAYAETINDSDTGIMSRNILNARITLATLSLLNMLNDRIVDCAGGYGILVRLLRDYGVEAFWSDPYCKNLLSIGFEYKSGSAALVTSFEAFEHFVDPVLELDKLLEIAPNVLFSTLLLPDPPPKPGNWWYYGQEHGQHIGFFTTETLENIARKAGKHLVSNGSSYHLFSEKPVNAALWKALIRLNILMPAYAKLVLKSRTWSDHLSIIDRKSE